MKDMAVPHLAKTYARGLYESAEEAGEITRVSDALSRLKTVSSKKSDWHRMLDAPSIPLKKRETFLHETAQTLSLPPLLSKWLKVVMVRRRLKYLEAMIEGFERIKRMRENCRLVVIDSALPLDTKQRQKVENSLKERFSQSLEIAWNHHPELLSGLRIRLAGHVQDLSLKGDLERLRRNLLLN